MLSLSPWLLLNVLLIPAPSGIFIVPYYKSLTIEKPYLSIKSFPQLHYGILLVYWYMYQVGVRYN